MRDCCPDPMPAPVLDARRTAGQNDAARTIQVALAGNPNCGKSTIFNALTGARQHVGNWPGKTVEKKAGRCTVEDVNGSPHTLTVIDLPGTYSLSAYSTEEIISMDYLLDERPDVVVVVVDAGNLERNLYLTVQIIEMGLPVIVALNMMDTAEARGLRIDADRLSLGLGGLPVVPTVARSGRGIEALKAHILEAACPAHPGLIDRKLADYGREVEDEITHLQAIIAEQPGLGARYAPRWLAVKLLEADPGLTARLADQPGVDSAALLAAAQAGVQRIENLLGDDGEIVIADRRYGFINGLVREVVIRPPLDRRTRSDRIDRVVTHPLWGLPIFAAAMYVVFQMTANVSAHYIDWIDGLIGGPLARWAAALLTLAGLSGTWVESLIIDGVMAGVGGVLVFIPVLALMYLFIALLEDSGYMARAAFLMDRFMHHLGLHGKSFIPMLLGFGCSVPGIYATRTLDDERDRLLTGLLVPFMSCGARLPIYVVIGVAFFGARAGVLVFAMYLLGTLAAIGVGLLLKNTLFRAKEQAPFVIELPPYRLPTLRGVLLHTWERTWAFIRNASTVILAASVIVWLLMSIPVGAPPDEATFADVETDHSALAALSRWIAPVFHPAGYGNWQAASSLMTGFVAKEVVVSTLSIVYVGSAPDEEAGETLPTFWQDLGEIGLTFALATWDTLRATVSLLPGLNLIADEEDGVPETGSTALIAALQQAFTPLAAVAFCVFVLLTAPCVTTIAALRQEFGGRWMAFSVGLMLVVAWAASVLVYQGGRLLGLG